MKYSLYLLSLMLGGCLASCGSASEQAIEDTWTPIAYWEVIKGDSVIVCDIDKVEPTTTIPLELIAEDYQIVKLDKEAEDFSVLSDTYVTENYIGLSSYSSAPFKLFGKDGTFRTVLFTYMSFYCLARLVVSQCPAYILCTEKRFALFITHGADSTEFYILKNLNFVHNK